MEFIDYAFIYSTSKGTLLKNEVNDIGKPFIRGSLEVDPGKESRRYFLSYRKGP